MARLIDDDERRARLGRRHALAAPVATPEEATAAVLALHSSDPTSVPLAVRARTGGLDPAATEAALYERRALVRLHGMRRTLWVVPRDLVLATLVAGSRPLVPTQRRRLRTMLEADAEAPPDPDAWVDAVAARTVAAAVARGEASANELGRDVPELGRKVVADPGSRWSVEVTVSSRLLVELGFRGDLVRGRPLGTWVSSQYRYAPLSALGDLGPEPDPAAARAEVVARYLRAFGPVTEADVRWWTGWTAVPVRAALAAAGAEEVRVEGGPALVAPGDAGPVAAPAPWVALLPVLDSTTMGWKGRDWYLGDLGPALFDRNGNAGPTLWCDGRVVGAWGVRPDATVALDLRVDVGAEARAALEAEAGAVEAWLGGVAVTPRFRTPSERALAAGEPVP